MHKAYGTGRRKTSSARVYLNEGTGQITINSRDIDNFIQSKSLKSYLMAPLEKSQLEDKVDLKINLLIFFIKFCIVGINFVFNRNP